MGELLRLRGRNQADAELRRGDLSAQMWSNLGNQIGNAITGYAQERQQAPIRAQDAEMRALQLREAQARVAQRETLSRQDQAFAQFLASNTNTETGEFMLPDPRGAIAILGPDRGLKAFEGIKAYHELQTGAVKDARDNAGRLALGVKALSPAMQAQMWPSIRTAAIKGGLGSEQDIPEQPSAEYLDAVIGWATGEPAPAPAKTPTREIKVRNADGSETIQIVEDAPGFSATSAAPLPANLDAAIMAAYNKGDQGEVNRLLGLKGRDAAATRAPETQEARRERQLRIKKLELDLQKAQDAPDNEKLAAALPVFDEITELSKRIFTSDKGPITNIIGAWRTGAARMNLDNDVNEYQSLVRGFTPLMARAVGHAGVLTEQDVQRTEMLFGNIGILGTDNATVAKNKLDRVKRIIAGGGSAEDKDALKREMGWGGGGSSNEVVYDTDGNPK